MKRSAIGVFNGNWKNKWKRELEGITARNTQIIENNKLDFGDALIALKQADPDWESWYDQDENIPPFIHWINTEEIKTLCKRMIERADHAEKKFSASVESGKKLSKRPDAKVR